MTMFSRHLFMGVDASPPPSPTMIRRPFFRKAVSQRTATGSLASQDMLRNSTAKAPEKNYIEEHLPNLHNVLLDEDNPFLECHPKYSAEPFSNTRHAKFCQEKAAEEEPIKLVDCASTVSSLPDGSIEPRPVPPPPLAQTAPAAPVIIVETHHPNNPAALQLPPLIPPEHEIPRVLPPKVICFQVENKVPDIPDWLFEHEGSKSFPANRNRLGPEDTLLRRNNLNLPNLLLDAYDDNPFLECHHQTYSPETVCSARHCNSRQEQTAENEPLQIEDCSSTVSSLSEGSFQQRPTLPPRPVSPPTANAPVMVTLHQNMPPALAWLSTAQVPSPQPEHEMPEVICFEAKNKIPDWLLDDEAWEEQQKTFPPCSNTTNMSCGSNHLEQNNSSASRALAAPPMTPHSMQYYSSKPKEGLESSPRTAPTATLSSNSSPAKSAPAKKTSSSAVKKLKNIWSKVQQRSGSNRAMEDLPPELALVHSSSNSGGTASGNIVVPRAPGCLI